MSFTGHKTIRRKLDEGDYNTPELIDKIAIERKSLQDLYKSIVTDHKRFKREILRAKDKGKAFYIFIEGKLEDFYYLNWTKRQIKIRPAVLEKIILTMRERYNLTIIECNTRDEMSKKICMEMEKWLTQQEQVKENM